MGFWKEVGKTIAEGINESAERSKELKHRRFIDMKRQFDDVFNKQPHDSESINEGIEIMNSIRTYDLNSAQEKMEAYIKKWAS